MLGLSVFDFLVSFNVFIILRQFLTNFWIHREKTTMSLTRWIKSATSLTNCAIPLSSCTTTNLRTPIWSLRIFCSWTPSTQHRSMQERWETWSRIHFTIYQIQFLRIAKFAASKVQTFAWLISAPRHSTMNITAQSYRPVTTALLKSFLSWDGHSLVMCGPSAASCLSFTSASRSSKHTIIANIWQWWKEFSAPFHTEWRGEFYICLFL